MTKPGTLTLTPLLIFVTYLCNWIYFYATEQSTFVFWNQSTPVCTQISSSVLSNHIWACEYNRLWSRCSNHYWVTWHTGIEGNMVVYKNMRCRMWREPATHFRDERGNIQEVTPKHLFYQDRIGMINIWINLSTQSTRWSDMVWLEQE